MSIDDVIGWAKSNPIMAAGVALAAVYLVKPSLFGTTRRRRRRKLSVAYVRRSHKKANRRKYTSRSKSKPAWMVKGSEAARRRMARLRRLRKAS